MSQKVYVLYHANCYDGFGSAFSAWQMYKDRATYIPAAYGKPMPEIEDGSLVYILDFSYKEAELQKLDGRNIEVIMLDHHATAEEFITPLITENKFPWLKVEFDMNRSGALMSWDHFIHNNNVHGYKLIQHISDRDLWKFELEGTKEVHAALLSYPMDFDIWDNFDLEELKTEGKALLRMLGVQVDNICRKAFIRKIDGHEVPVVNTTIAWSEVGHKLLELYPDAKFAASFSTYNEITMWSLRSRKDFNVSEVAKKFGGGGHPQASGFQAARV